MGVVVAEHPTSADYWGGAEAPEHFGMSVARRLGADYPAPLADNKVLQLVEQRAGFKFRAAYRAVRTPGAQAFVSMSEQVGVPLAVLDRHRTPHVVVAHNVITPFKRRLQSTTHWLEWFDRIVVFSHVMGQFLVSEVGLPGERVHVVPHPTDQRFFSPQADAVVDPSLVVAVGREHRDYTTLVESMRRLPEARAVIVANSPWAKRRAPGEALPAPSNVEFRPFLPAGELRSLMARAAVIAVPLQAGLTFGAGLNGLCEAHAMGRPVVATSTPGLLEHLDNAATLSVPPSDAVAMASALRQVMQDGAGADRMGALGRQLIEAGHSNDNFAERIATLVEQVC